MIAEPYGWLTRVARSVDAGKGRCARLCGDKGGVRSFRCLVAIPKAGGRKRFAESSIERRPNPAGLTAFDI